MPAASTAWELRRALRERLADEDGAIRREARRRVALCYPSPYHVGMSSLGFQTVYRELNADGRVAAERAFLPDDVEEHRAARAPLFTLETLAPVGGFDALA